jgi:hypothetical protein
MNQRQSKHPTPEIVKYFPAYLFLAGIIIFVLTSYKPGVRDKEKVFQWKGLNRLVFFEMGYWSVKDKAIVGHSNATVAKNQFLWSDVEVKDFYLSVDVLLAPNERNAGIQFSLRKADESGQALGYQADVGQVFGGSFTMNTGVKN